MRLDVYLVKNHLVESRAKAQDLIVQGHVLVNDKSILKCSYDVLESDRVQLQENEVLKYVSRAGLKLEKAFSFLSIDLVGKKVLDVGQSTGGFTDCCLQWGADRVVGIDVGQDQLHEKLKEDPRVTFLQGLHVKNLATSDFFLNSVPQNGFDLVVCDVSFISLENVIPFLPPFLKNDGQYVILVKPQFECGPSYLDKKGLVKDVDVYPIIEQKIRQLCLNHLGRVESYFESLVPGRDGNTEFFIYGRKNLS